MTVTFVLKDNNNNTLKEYILQYTEKILDLKDMIVKDYYENKGSVDINLLLDRAKRVFGKYNLEPGILPQSFDNRLLNEFAISNSEIINIKAEHIDTIIKHEEEVVNNNNTKKTGKYVPPHKMNLSISNSYNSINQDSNKINNKPFVFEELDFPPL